MTNRTAFWRILGGRNVQLLRYSVFYGADGLSAFLVGGAHFG